MLISINKQTPLFVLSNTSKVLVETQLFAINYNVVKAFLLRIAQVRVRVQEYDNLCTHRQGWVKDGPKLF